jgi:hypothetical protein
VIRVLLLLVIALGAGCASQGQKEVNTKNTEQAIRDFILVRQLGETDRVRSSNDDSYEKLDPHFVLYKTRRGTYLLEFSRKCYELGEYPVVADIRRDGSAIRAGFDTLRGCRIDKLFELSEGEVAELQNIGESPGSRN